MAQEMITHTYRCPLCNHINKRNFKASVQLACDSCKKYFNANDNWESSSCSFQTNHNDRVYYVGGIQFAKGMSFDVKMEQVAKKFKPKFLEHGNGYAVFEYDLAHTATCACNHLRANATKREDWELSTNGSRLAVIEKNWTPPASQKKKEEDDNDNSSYAG